MLYFLYWRSIHFFRVLFLFRSSCCHTSHRRCYKTLFFMYPIRGWEVHNFILLKSFIVLSSWAFGYFGMKHLPLTIVGPINATRPVMTLVGAMLIFGERLNLYQWIGVFMAVISFFMLSRSGKRKVSIQTRPMDMVCSTGCGTGSSKRTIRQISYGKIQ